MLQEKITRPQNRRDDGPAMSDRDPQNLTTVIMDALDQGVIFWSRDGRCQIFNRQILDRLELQFSSLSTETHLADFIGMCCARGDFTKADMHNMMGRFTANQPFQFDSTLPSGRVISANVRPARGGGCLVAYTDVSEERQALKALTVARAEAEDAQRRATELLNDERARRRESGRLAKLDEWLQSCKSLEELFQIVTAFMQNVLPATRGQLFIYSNSRDTLELVSTWHTTAEQDHVTPDSCWALRRGRKYIFEPDQFCFPCDHVTEANEPGALLGRSMCIPIVAHAETVGMLHLAFDAAGDNPDVRYPVKFASLCAEHISMAIANVKLRDELQDQSTRDPLTGLYNRRFFIDALRREIARAEGHQATFALVTLDADKFKQFNDDHGHDAGDCVLEAVAAQMRALNWPNAASCRIGGEEFAIILPQADRTRASAIVEDLRVIISETKVKYMSGFLPRVSVSAGIAIYPTHGTKPQELIKQSDTALYAAKKAGRNCWRVAEGDGLIYFD